MSDAERLKPGDVGPYGELAARAPQQDLTLTFSPPLVMTLRHIERTLGRPLQRAELETLRDQVPVVVLPTALVEEVAAERGYRDINAANNCEEWQARRTQAG